MIGVDMLQELVELNFWTAYLEDDRPGSLLILAEVESGKSDMVCEYDSNNGIVFESDISAYGIMNKYKKRLQDGSLKHFVFPEFIHPLSHKHEAVTTFIAMLNSLMAEGLREIENYATHVSFDPPAHCGIVACLARGEFEGNRAANWKKNGFLSRFIPVTYSHSQALQDAVFENIYTQHRDSQSRTLAFHSGSAILVKSLATKLNKVAKNIAYECSASATTRTLYGYRAQVNLQRLAKARALAAGRPVVMPEDIDRITELSKYMNLAYEAI